MLKFDYVKDAPQIIDYSQKLPYFFPLSFCGNDLIILAYIFYHLLMNFFSWQFKIIRLSVTRSIFGRRVDVSPDVPIV